MKRILVVTIASACAHHAPEGVAPGATAVVAGSEFTCALANDRVSCWGMNSDGQLGDGSRDDSLVPAIVPGLSNVRALAAGALHACAIVDGGRVMCWGSNSEGQLGGGPATGSYTPVEASGIVGATALALGFEHSCAIVAGGAVTCWGSNSEGQLGAGNGVTGATAIAAGVQHTCALAGGTVTCWGDNTSGELGASGLAGVTAIAAGGTWTQDGSGMFVSSFAHTCAATADGVRCFGDNMFGELGNGQPAGATVLAMSATWGAEQLPVGDHACAIAGGGLSCWGYNASGELGIDSSTEQSTSPVPGPFASGVTQVATGHDHTCAFVDGALYCWGGNGFGQLGDGTVVDRLAPVEVSLP